MSHRSAPHFTAPHRDSPKRSPAIPNDPENVDAYTAFRRTYFWLGTSFCCSRAVCSWQRFWNHTTNAGSPTPMQAVCQGNVSFSSSFFRLAPPLEFRWGSSTNVGHLVRTFSGFLFDSAPALVRDVCLGPSSQVYLFDNAPARGRDMWLAVGLCLGSFAGSAAPL